MQSQLNEGLCSQGVGEISRDEGSRGLLEILLVLSLSLPPLLQVEARERARILHDQGGRFLPNLFWVGKASGNSFLPWTGFPNKVT